MDRALALRMIRVMAPGRSVAGEAALAAGERRWQFVPAQPWRAGAHRVLIGTTIEDLAGNNIGKAFDVETANDIPRGLATEQVEMAFQVK